jgi:polyisoprenoid-binding protein YceI
MQKISVLAIGLFLSLGVFAQSWTLDKMHSQLNFSVKHMGISFVEGGFKSVSATVTSSKDDLSDAVIELSAEVNSINTGVDMRDNHLKTDAFFDAAKYPTLTFKSTSFTKVDGKSYQMTGDLTLHGVTKPVTLNVVFNGTATNPQSQKTSAGFTITGTIKRSDFNIGAAFPDAMLSDAVNLDANTEFVKG